MSETKILDINLLEFNKGQIEGLPKNPRMIRDARFDALKKSIQDAPEMLNLRELIVYPIKGQSKIKYVVICGNMRLKAMKDLNYMAIPCKILDEKTPPEKLREYAIKDNIAFGDDDWDSLAGEWETEELLDWGVELPDVEEENYKEMQGIEEEAELERKKREFENKMKNGEITEEDEEYQEFLAKFEAKKTTDDCYTPTVVYEAVADYVAKEYGLKKAFFVRPFYPGGDYKKEFYGGGEIVVDNPPFSIITEIVNFYNKHKIKFFLFAPHLTLFSSGKNDVCYLPVGVPITYENGALVNTSFITNLEREEIQAKTAPELYNAVKQANEENLKEKRRELPKYVYPEYLITTPLFQAFSRYGIDFKINKNECQFVRQLESQKKAGKGIFGGGFLISTTKKAEREKAEREKAEREKADVWELSEKEIKIIQSLDTHKSH